MLLAAQTLIILNKPIIGTKTPYSSFHFGQATCKWALSLDTNWSALVNKLKSGETKVEEH